jgi:hypothetical protein
MSAVLAVARVDRLKMIVSRALARSYSQYRAALNLTIVLPCASQTNRPGLLSALVPMLVFCLMPSSQGIPSQTPKHKSATLAISSSATIHGQTTTQVVKIQEFSAPDVIQGFVTLDTIDVALSVNFLFSYSISIVPNLDGEDCVTKKREGGGN